MSDIGPNIYIGSTTEKYLQTRFSSHKNHYKSIKNIYKASTGILFKEYGIDNCYIVLVESFPCNTVDELHAREEYWRKNMPNVINRRSIILSEEERIERRKKNSIRSKEKRKANKTLIHCPYCFMDISSMTFRQSHLRSDRHKANVDWVNACFNN